MLEQTKYCLYSNIQEEVSFLDLTFNLTDSQVAFDIIQWRLTFEKQKKLLTAIGVLFTKNQLNGS